MMRLSDFKQLPESLSLMLTIQLHRKLIQGCPVFQNLPSVEAVIDLLMHLQPELYTPSTIVIHEGEPNTRLYFINRGTVWVWARFSSGEGDLLATLSANDFFGEASLMHKHSPVANATVQCASFCDVLTLKDKHFQAVLSRYEGLEDELQRSAEARNQKREKRAGSVVANLCGRRGSASMKSVSAKDPLASHSPESRACFDCCLASASSSAAGRGPHSRQRSMRAPTSSQLQAAREREKSRKDAARKGGVWPARRTSEEERALRRRTQEEHSTTKTLSGHKESSSASPADAAQPQDASAPSVSEAVNAGISGHV